MTARRGTRQRSFPSVWPALLMGFALAFARSLGEYGSVVLISGNRPMAAKHQLMGVVVGLDPKQSKDSLL